MKRVININFQGRVIPIEESAYDILKTYIDSLRKYFANEEGRDEIVNDIESRIGELFAERLKTGANCIVDEDVQVVIASIGRPEDFEAQGAEAPPAPEEQPKTGSQQQQSRNFGRGKLYRNDDDKILGGVCSGLANYLNIDPIIVRIAFILLAGAIFWVYILLWVVIPSKSIQSNITKRLYRSADDKMIAGVAGGLAAYFNLPIWAPRVIFALPFVLALISGSMHSFWYNWDFDFIPRIISGSLGSTMFITYVILWIVVPVANTASEKLEMRGEKVDLNSIANTVKGDLEQFRVRTEKWSNDIRSSSKNPGAGIAHAIRVIFKAFFIFILATIALTLFGAFVGILFGGAAFSPLQSFIFEGRTETVLAWVTLILVFLLPIIALITWGITRLVGARSTHRSLSYTFFSLWLIGVVAGVTLCYMIARDFKTSVMLDEEQVAVVAPASNKIFVDVEGSDWKKHNNQFFGFDVDGDFPWYSKGNDSLMINTIRISMVKSQDSSFHIYRIKGSRGRNQEMARDAAEKISFEPLQADSVVVFPRVFAISREEKFRNQRVWIVVEVPVGKRIEFSEGISNWDWMEMNNRKSQDYGDWDNIGKIYQPVPGSEYIMHEDGKPRAANKSVVEI